MDKRFAMRPYLFRTHSPHGMSLIYCLPCSFDERSSRATPRLPRKPKLIDCVLASNFRVFPPSLHRQALHQMALIDWDTLKDLCHRPIRYGTRSIKPRRVIPDAKTWLDIALRPPRNGVTNELGPTTGHRTRLWRGSARNSTVCQQRALAIRHSLSSQARAHQICVCSGSWVDKVYY